MIGDRLYTFVVNNEFGSRIAAQCVGRLIYAVVKVRMPTYHGLAVVHAQTHADKYFPFFYAHLYSNLKRLLTGKWLSACAHVICVRSRSDEVLKADIVDNAVMWHLTLYAQLLREAGPATRAYDEQ